MNDPVANILARLDGVKKDGKGWKARCPSHEDRNPSLSIAVGDDGRVLLKCFTGCTVADICRAISLEEKDLFVTSNKPPKKRSAKPPRPPKTVASVDAFVAAQKGQTEVYFYDGADENTVMAVVRTDRGNEKTFTMMHPMDGAWVLEAPKGLRPLYCLSNIGYAQPVYVFEGEKCVLAAMEIGLVQATTSSGGSSSPHKTDWRPLADHDVVILPDHDKAGMKYAKDVASILLALDPPARVKVLELPGLNDGEDLVQYVTVERIEFADCIICAHIEELAAAAPYWTDPDAEGLVTRCLADVQTEKVSWLWPQRFALGKLSLLVGNPALGKSFVSLDIAAKVTTGTAWPDRRDVPITSGGVLLLTAEDGLGDTVRPRLEAAKANLNHVTVIEGVRRPESKGILDTFDLQRDVHRLSEELDARDDIRLIVIDPLSAYLGRECDSHKDADVRRVLTPLAEMAAAYHVAVLGIMHLNKGGTGLAIHRAMGSLAFVAAARAVWLLGRDKLDPERRFVLQVKNNLAPDPGGMAFRIEDPGVIHWDDGVVSQSADDLLLDTTKRSRRALDDCEDFLRNILRDSPVASDKIRAEAESAGLCWRTLQTAKTSLGIRAKKEGKHWIWTLPS